MKLLILVICITLSGVLAEPQAPYAASGWRPEGRAFELPQRTPKQYLPPLQPRVPLPRDLDDDVSVQGLPDDEQLPQFQGNGQYQPQRQFYNSQTVPQNVTPRQLTARPEFGFTKPTISTASTSTTMQSDLNEGEDETDNQQNNEEEEKKKIPQPDTILTPVAQIRLQTISTNPSFVPNQQQILVQQGTTKLGQFDGLDGSVHFAALQRILAQQRLVPDSFVQTKQVVIQSVPEKSGQIQSSPVLIVSRNLLPAQNLQSNVDPLLVQYQTQTIEQNKENNERQLNQGQTSFVVQTQGYQPQDVQVTTQNVQFVPQNVGYQPQYDGSDVQNGQYVTQNVNYPQLNIQYQDQNLQYQPQNVQYQPQNVQLQTESVQPPQTLPLQYQQPNIQYQPQNLQYDPQNVHVQPENVKYQPQNVQLQTVSVQPQQTLQYQQPNIQYQPQNLQYDPQNVQVQTDNMRVQTDNVQPQTVQYVPNVYQPQKVQSSSQTFQLQPQNVQYQAKQTLPQSVEYQPQIVQLQPLNVQLQPQNVQVQPQNLNGQYDTQNVRDQNNDQQTQFQNKENLDNQNRNFYQVTSNYQPQSVQQGLVYSQSQPVYQKNQGYSLNQQYALNQQFAQNQYQPYAPIQQVDKNQQYDQNQQFTQNQLFAQNQPFAQLQYYQYQQLNQAPTNEQATNQGADSLQSGLDVNKQGNDLGDEKTDDDEDDDDSGKEATTKNYNGFGDRTRPKYGVSIPKQVSSSPEVTSDENATTENYPVRTDSGRHGRRKNAKLRNRRVRPVFTVDNSGHLVLSGDQA